MHTITTETGSASSVIATFNDAFNRHDVDAIMALMTDDCVFENTFPAPDGERYSGQHDVRAFWTRLFHNTPTAHFEVEDQFTTGDRAAVCWRYTWRNPDGREGHIRGVDIFRIRDGKVAEKHSYVKG